MFKRHHRFKFKHLQGDGQVLCFRANKAGLFMSVSSIGRMETHQLTGQAFVELGGY